MAQGLSKPVTKSFKGKHYKTRPAQRRRPHEFGQLRLSLGCPKKAPETQDGPAHVRVKLQVGHKMVQYGARWEPEGPKQAQDGPSWPQGRAGKGAGWAPRRARKAQERPTQARKAQERPKLAQERPEKKGPKIK